MVGNVGKADMGFLGLEGKSPGALTRLAGRRWRCTLSQQLGPQIDEGLLEILNRV